MAHVFEKKWRSDDVRLQENVDFSSLLLSERLLAGLKKAGFKKPSPIQVEAVPMGHIGKDLMVQAKSGTGKTLVFVIIALDTLKYKLFRPQTLVVVPTREIATQICSVIKTVGSTFPKLTCNSFIGGLPLFEDKEKAVMSQIVVGTPGRLRQLIQLKALPTNSIRLVVFDEADELLYSNSFKDDIDDIFSSLPDEKQVIATSATFSPTTKKLMLRYLRDYHLIRLNAKQLALLGIFHYGVVVEFCPMPILQYKFKLAALEKILKTVQFSQCLLFCNGIQRVEILYRDIKKWGFSTAYITSAKEQCDRLKAIDRLKRFKCKVLVSSDLTSRGIDAENVDLVINFDLSYVTEVYMHRVGRAGRYGTVGVAISILHESEIKHMKRIEKEGSFKVYKLPDPIPKDLILYPVEEDFLIDESDSENTNGSEVKDSVKSNNVTRDVLNKKDYDSNKQVSAKNFQVEDYSETNVDIDDENCENALSEPATLSTSDIKSHDGITMSTVECETKVEKVDKDVISNSSYYRNNDDCENTLSETTIQCTSDDKKSHDDITNPTAECEIKVEKVDEDDNSHSVYFNEEETDKILQNGYVDSNNLKLDENKDSDLLNDCDINELIDRKSTNRTSVCDIYENSSDLRDGNVFEKQSIVNDSVEKDVHLNSQLFNNNDNLEKSGFEIDGKGLKEMHIDNVSESSEIKDIAENTQDDSVTCDQESVKSSDTLNKVKAFVDTYESSKRVESTETKVTFDDCHSNENSGKKLITIDMINNLKSQKNDFLYKTFKTFLETKDGHSVADKNTKEDKIQKNNEDINMSSENANNSTLVSAEITTVHAKLAGSSECETRKVFPEKPDFESTPQPNDKIKKENSKKTSDEAVSKPIIQDKLNQLLQELSDESDFVDSDSNEFPKQNASADSTSSSLSSESETESSSPSDSESDSSSGHSRSESESDNSDLSSATSSANEDIYHHNYSRTGRQNPSLISNSSGNRMHHHHTHANYFQNTLCPCSSTAMHCIPQQSTVRSPETSGRVNRHRRHRVIDQNASAPFSQEGNASYFRGAFQPVNPRRNLCSRRDFQTASRRERSSADLNVAQSSFSRSHSRYHRSMNSPRNTTCEENQNRSENPIRRRSSRCRHTLCCFLPTEHRCHPNIPDYPCNQGPICQRWYETFYNQWLHIQNVIN